MTKKEKEKKGFAYLFGRIERDSVKSTIKEIDQANNDAEVKDITLRITSRWWLIGVWAALYDLIHENKKPINGVASWSCWSAAVMVLQACKKRYAHKNTVFMIHQSNSQILKVPHDEFLAKIDYLKIMEKKFFELSFTRATLSKKEIKKLYDPIKYLSAEEALKIWLIDEIIE